MRNYRDFQKALADFRESGGAINYYDGLWQVGDYAEIKEAVETTTKDATINALRQGGMTEEEIAQELADWTHALQINGAWYINQLPEHLVIELVTGELRMTRVSPFRHLTGADLEPYRGHHPRKCKGHPLPDYLYRFYGLEKSDETANEVIHVRMTPSEKLQLQTAADGAGQTVSEYVRGWVKTL